MTHFSTFSLVILSVSGLFYLWRALFDKTGGAPALIMELLLAAFFLTPVICTLLAHS